MLTDRYVYKTFHQIAIIRGELLKEYNSKRRILRERQDDSHIEKKNKKVN